MSNVRSQTIGKLQYIEEFLRRECAGVVVHGGRCSAQRQELLGTCIDRLKKIFKNPWEYPGAKLCVGCTVNHSMHLLVAVAENAVTKSKSLPWPGDGPKEVEDDGLDADNVDVDFKPKPKAEAAKGKKGEAPPPVDLSKEFEGTGDDSDYTLEDFEDVPAGEGL